VPRLPPREKGSFPKRRRRPIQSLKQRPLQNGAVFVFFSESDYNCFIMNKKIIFVVVAFILAIGIGLLVGLYIAPKWMGIERPYYGVLLEGGDFYVGRLNRFPAFWKMTDALLLQTAVDPENPEQATFSLTPIKEGSIWSPDALLINPQNIIFWGRVGKDSEVMRVIRGNAAPISQPVTPARELPALPIDPAIE